MGYPVIALTSVHIKTGMTTAKRVGRDGKSYDAPEAIIARHKPGTPFVIESDDDYRDLKKLGSIMDDPNAVATVATVAAAPVTAGKGKGKAKAKAVETPAPAVPETPAPVVPEVDGEAEVDDEAEVDGEAEDDEESVM